jgi:hypothetical protein
MGLGGERVEEIGRRGKGLGTKQPLPADRKHKAPVLDLLFGLRLDAHGLVDYHLRC